jgi:zinc transporter ZupT
MVLDIVTLWVDSLAVAIALSILHFIGEEFSEHIERFHSEILSFGAGILVSIFFLEILPHITIGEAHLNEFIYVTFLIGFVLMYVLENLIYQQATSEDEIVRDTLYFEAAGLIAYGLLVGIIIVLFLDAYGEFAYIIFAPFFIRAFGVSLTSSHINERLTSRLNRLMQYLSPVIGSFVGLLLITEKVQLFLVFSIAMGLILYIVVRDMIPFKKESKPIYFVLGALIVLVVFLVTLAI